METMRTLLVSLLLAVPLVAAAGAQEADPRVIQKLERRVERLQAEHEANDARLHDIYSELESALGDLDEQEAARLRAELARVLEPVLRQAREIEGPGTMLDRRLRKHFEKNLPAALDNLELAALKRVAPYLQAQLEKVIREGDSIRDALSLEPDTLSRRALEVLLNDQVPFHLRWNDLIAENLPAARAYQESHQNLEEARQELAVAKDPLLLYRIGAPEGYARVPSGSYQMNFTAGFASGSGRRKPRRFRLNQPVYVGLYEVTAREYLAWLESLEDVDERLRRTPRDEEGKHLWEKDEETGLPAPAEEELDHPVTGISLADALDYAAWRGARLPTEEEWCAMAGGHDGLVWPWGDTFSPSRCNSKEMGTGSLQPVGSYPDGRGPFGHYDVAGNAAEWLMTYENGEEIVPGELQDLNAVIRGGSYRNGRDGVSTGWLWLSPARFGRAVDLGFRLALDAEAAGQR